MTKFANDNTPPSRLVAMREVETLTSMSRTLILALMNEDKFPQNVQLGPRRYAFVRAEVEAWIDTRIASRGKAVAS